MNVPRSQDLDWPQPWMSSLNPLRWRTAANPSASSSNALPLGHQAQRRRMWPGPRSRKRDRYGIVSDYVGQKVKTMLSWWLVNIKEVVNDSVNGCKWIIPPSACIEAYWSMKGWSILAGITFVKMLKKVLLRWPAAQRTEMDRVKRSMQGFQEEGLHSTPGWAYLSLSSRIGQECCEKTCAAVNCSLPGWAPNQSKELEIGSTPEAPKASKSWGGRTLAKRVSSVSTAKAGKIIIMNIMWVLTHRHITRLMILLLAKCWGDWKGNIILWQSSLNRLSRSSFSDRRVFCVCLFEGFTLCGYLWLLYFMQLHLHLPERLLSMAPSLWRHRQKYCSCPQPTIALRMAILMRKDDKIDLSICFLPCFVCWLTECLVVLPS